MKADLAWLAATAAVSSGWVAATIGGWDLGFDTTSRGTAAAAAAAALIGAAWRPSPGRTAAVPVFLLLLLPLALAQATGRSSALLVVMLVCHAAIEASRAIQKSSTPPWRRALPVLGLVLGSVCLIAGIAVDGGEGLSRPLPSAETLAAIFGAAAAAFLVLVASLGPSEARPVVVPGLLIGLVAVPGLPDLAVAATGAVAAILWAARGPLQPAPALAALALAATVVPAAAQASGLLAAAAALSLALPHPAAALLGLPGAAALAAGTVAGDVDEAVIVVLIGVVVSAVALGRRPGMEWPLPVGRTALPLAPAGGMAIWLLLSPGSWGWTGAGGLGTYDRGASVAVAAALLAVVGGRVKAMSSGPVN